MARILTRCKKGKNVTEIDETRMKYIPGIYQTVGMNSRGTTFVDKKYTHHQDLITSIGLVNS